MTRLTIDNPDALAPGQMGSGCLSYGRPGAALPACWWGCDASELHVMVEPWVDAPLCRAALALLAPLAGGRSITTCRIREGA